MRILPLCGALLFLSLPVYAAEISTPASVASPTLISITAESYVEAEPDYVEMRVGVVTQAPQAQAALAANAQRMANIRKALTKAGIAPRDIQTQQLNLQPQYRYSENQPPLITGYQANMNLRIVSRNLKETGALLDLLVAQGINQIDGPNYGITNMESLRDNARIAALKTAQARIALYAKAAGLKVRRIVEISEPSADMPQPQPMVRVLALESAGAKTEIDKGSLAVRASVNVRAELE